MAEDSMPQSTGDSRAVFFFDIDNCLYPRSKKVHELMSVLIDQYFVEHLSLTEEDANHLHMRYYKEYGLAIEGLVRHHKVEPLEYNEKVDDALPLDGLLAHDPELRELLQSFDKSKVKMWLFTNAYVNHGRRVIKLLGIEDCFEGLTYCDYGAGVTGEGKMVCKPHHEAFEKAEREAGAAGKDIYFVDDSKINCKAAHDRGWQTVHKIEPEDEEPEKIAKYTVRRLQELQGLFPHLFKQKMQGRRT